MLRKVLKKVPALAVGLALVLTASQLALAQQTAGTTAQQPSTTTPTQNGGTASDPGQFLTVDGQNLVISCPKLEEGLAQLAAQGNTSSDPQVQEQLQLAQSMDQLCKANGVGASDVTTPP